MENLVSFLKLFDPVVIGLGIWLMIFTIVAAKLDDTLELRPGGVNIPLTHHGVLWTAPGLLLLLSFFTGMYGDQWSSTSVTTMSWCAIGISTLMYIFYVAAKSDDAFVHSGGVRIAGLWNLLYMSGALTIIGLVYFKTDNIPNTTLWKSTALLTLITATHNHIFLEIFGPRGYDRRGFRDNAFAVITILIVGAVLSWLTYRKVGYPEWW